MKEMHTENRHRLLSKLPGALLIVTAYSSIQMSKDMAFPFHQEANFWWLTGLDEPSWILVFDGLRRHSVLVRPHASKTKLVFDGSISDEEVMQVSGVDEIIDENDFEKYLRQVARKHTVAYTVYDKTEYEFASNPAQHELYLKIKRIFPSTHDCTKQISELRSVKTETEIKLIRQAIDLTCKSFAEVRAKLDSYKYENELEADFTRNFRRGGTCHAYEPIVASGANAITLHYVKNQSRIKKNDLILMDIGAKFGAYCADISRTYAINPTKRQRQVHQAVETAHHEIISLLCPGLEINAYLVKVDMIMKQTLIGLGLLENMDDDTTYRRYFPHSISHGLGVDVHDSLGGNRAFVKGMVLTVEPGIYIKAEGIGVRIEDDILITETGCENMSRKLSTGL